MPWCHRTNQALPTPCTTACGVTVGYIVGTGMISVPIPGAWRRLSLICADGPLSGLAGQQLVGQLEELGIPRHHYGLVRVMLSWRQAFIPPDVAFALWLLREKLPKNGGLPRRASTDPEDTGPTIRYIQLATDAGETLDTDPALQMLASWLIDQQLSDGSIPANLGTNEGEAGTTARALRALKRINHAALSDNTDRMRRYLVEQALSGSHGTAWSYSPHDHTLVTGATSLAALALLEHSADEALLPDIFRFLIAAQNASGGWSEVPGHTPTIHNTFNAVRAINLARDKGVVDGRFDGALASATQWFRGEMNRRTSSRDTLDLSYALRLAAELDMLQEEPSKKLALALCQRRSKFLDNEADLYAETEIAALAILECSRRLEAASKNNREWAWRWSLPSLPPPFLCRTPYIYEVLYGIIRARWWIKIVDSLVRTSMVDRAAGLLLGSIAALGIVDDHITSIFTLMAGSIRGSLTIAFIATMMTAWITVKSCAYSSITRAIRKSIGSLLISAILTLLLLTPAPIYPTIIALTMLRWLITDVIAYTVDSSGFLRRLTIR